MEYRGRNRNKISFHANGWKATKKISCVKNGGREKKKELIWISKLNYWVFALFTYMTTMWSRSAGYICILLLCFSFRVWKLLSPHSKPTKKRESRRSPVEQSASLLRTSLLRNCFLHRSSRAKDWGGRREGEQYDKRDGRENDWGRKRNKLSQSETVGESDDRMKWNATEQPEGYRNVGF